MRTPGARGRWDLMATDLTHALLPDFAGSCPKPTTNIWAKAHLGTCIKATSFATATRLYNWWGKKFGRSLDNLKFRRAQSTNRLKTHEDTDNRQKDVIYKQARETRRKGVNLDLLHWREPMGRLPKRKAAMLRVLQSPGKLSQRPAAGPSGLKLILAPWADAVAQELAPSLSRMSCISCVDRAHPIASSKRIVAHLSTSPRPGAPGPSGLKLILAPATT